MEDEILTEIPVQYNRIKADTERLSFQMNSDLFTGSLLKTLLHQRSPAGYWNLEQEAVWRLHGYWMAWISARNF